MSSWSSLVGKRRFQHAAGAPSTGTQPSSGVPKMDVCELMDAIWTSSSPPSSITSSRSDAQEQGDRSRCAATADAGPSDPPSHPVSVQSDSTGSRVQESMNLPVGVSFTGEAFSQECRSAAPPTPAAAAQLAQPEEQATLETTAHEAETSIPESAHQFYTVEDEQPVSGPPQDWTWSSSPPAATSAPLFSLYSPRTDNGPNPRAEDSAEWQVPYDDQFNSVIQGEAQWQRSYEAVSEPPAQQYRPQLMPGYPVVDAPDTRSAVHQPSPYEHSWHLAPQQNAHALASGGYFSLNREDPGLDQWHHSQPHCSALGRINELEPSYEDPTISRHTPEMMMQPQKASWAPDNSSRMTNDYGRYQRTNAAELPPGHYTSAASSSPPRYASYESLAQQLLEDGIRPEPYMSVAEADQQAEAVCPTGTDDTAVTSDPDACGSYLNMRGSALENDLGAFQQPAFQADSAPSHAAESDPFDALLRRLAEGGDSSGPGSSSVEPASGVTAVVPEQSQYAQLAAQLMEDTVAAGHSLHSLLAPQQDALRSLGAPEEDATELALSEDEDLVMTNLVEPDDQSHQPAMAESEGPVDMRLSVHNPAPEDASQEPSSRLACVARFNPVADISGAGSAASSETNSPAPPTQAAFRSHYQLAFEIQINVL
ncbi:hypothetical protein WJX73_003026 [Symbiochloris irregularis]|uniref:Uncharacterized protein n=1 Tax=Symbiochloris irregularis TaxID=706552 RepID=A0AAW1PNB1_9CHLO